MSSNRTYYTVPSYNVASVKEDGPRLEHLVGVKGESGEYFTHTYLMYGEYAGAGTIGVSNINVLREKFSELEDVAWFEAAGAYGFHTIVFVMEKLTEELTEFLEKLDDYPVADEDDLSDIEHEETEKAWKSYAEYNFKRSCIKVMPHHTELIGRLPSHILRSMWRDMAEQLLGGEEVQHEQGGPFFPFSSVFGERAGYKQMTPANLRTYIQNAIITRRE